MASTVAALETHLRLSVADANRRANRLELLVGGVTRVGHYPGRVLITASALSVSLSRQIATVGGAVLTYWISRLWAVVRTRRARPDIDAIRDPLPLGAGPFIGKADALALGVAERDIPPSPFASATPSGGASPRSARYQSPVNGSPVRSAPADDGIRARSRSSPWGRSGPPSIL